MPQDPWLPLCVQQLTSGGWSCLFKLITRQYPSVNHWASLTSHNNILMQSVKGTCGDLVREFWDPSQWSPVNVKFFVPIYSNGQKKWLMHFDSAVIWRSKTHFLRKSVGLHGLSEAALNLLIFARNWFYFGLHMAPELHRSCIGHFFWECFVKHFI